MWIALIIAKHEGVKDTGKIVKMALVHDITESRTGDAHYISRQYVKRDEDLAIADMMEGTAIEDEFVELWREHEKKLSIEAKIVKDADNLEVDFDLREQPFEDEKRRAGWQPVRTQAVYDRLYTKTAKKMWKAIQSSNPHDWHRLGRNRFNAGDWKKKKRV
jgi:putative hydrolase of HD superfamily